MSDNADRLGKLTDLTRWNRAGLPRFDYVDGDAAVWLEELRIATMGLVARGATFEERLPETWRKRFSEDPAQWPDAAARAAFEDALAWKTLARAFPDRAETAGRRNKRLLDQYASNSGEYGWEIMRAAARAAHVLLGHLNAYANEGYIRTATQWDNLARLAAMVNHQPAPPTSATTTVGLLVDPTADDSAVEIERGLAMKYTPPEGGAPVVFETLKPLKVHPDLNAARATGWDSDPDNLADTDLWLDVEEAELAPGALGVLASADNSGPVDAVVMTDAQREFEPGIARISIDRRDRSWTRGDVVLHVDAKAVRRGSPRSTNSVLVLKLATASNYPINSVIKLHYNNDSTSTTEVVIGNTDGHLKLSSNLGSTLAHGANVTVETLVPVSNTGKGNLAPASVGTVAFFVNTSGAAHEGTGAIVNAVASDGTTLEDSILGIDFSGIADVFGSFYVETEGAKREKASVVGVPPSVVPGSHQPRRVVAFSGKPPKGLGVGDLMVMRSASDVAPTGLRVLGVAVADDHYTLQFHRDMPQAVTSFEPDAWEFHGPMVRPLRPKDHDRNPRPAFDGPAIIVEAINDKARELVRLGKTCLVEDERDQVGPVLATLVEAVEVGQGLKLLFEPAEGLVGFSKGWTTLNLNAVSASHGESKSAKVLGSGDAEVALQRFAFSARDVSFIPSNIAETGVAPDIDVEVDGVLWGYRDLIDPTAHGSQSYSVSLSEDNALTVHFRRRLPTGANNVVIRRYRSGVGPTGTVPARSFVKPMKKHRYVRALTQPFAATGGAEREPVADIRVNAPARLAANGRAVSLVDFERLCRRRSDVWQAKARAVSSPLVAEDVAIVVVPANGGVVGATLREDLVEFIEGRALPGVRVAIEDFEAVRLIVEATVRVDVDAYDKSEVQAAAQAALIATFALEQRALGQPVYIAEVAAALERVEGVATATVQTFQVPALPSILRTAKTAGSASAFFPFQHQVISADPASAGADMAVAVEAL
ncbi:MAG: hypothetical protein KDI82_02605 [Gammaproteobacteria bacterium]|nr:hypothetical protein [Gammaproteobacteria bacterium]